MTLQQQYQTLPVATALVSTLNNCHPAISFTMEVSTNNKLPFHGVEIWKRGCHLTTMFYQKPTNTGLLSNYQSHVDHRYKRSLLKTMLNRTYRLSSSWELFIKKCEYLKQMFLNLCKYRATNLIGSTIATFVNSVIAD